MDFRDYPRPLRAAIEAIVDENTSLHVATVIEDDDARPYLTDDVMNAFWVVQRAADYAQHILTEALQDLTEAEEATLHSAIATGCNPSVGKIVSDAVRDYVAHWLAQQAEAYRDQPTQDSPVARHERVITGTGAGADRRELQALCRGLRVQP
jgi:hypothetical protein